MPRMVFCVLKCVKSFHLHICNKTVAASPINATSSRAIAIP
jgi:hypothetical protein